MYNVNVFNTFLTVFSDTDPTYGSESTGIRLRPNVVKSFRDCRTLFSLDMVRGRFLYFFLFCYQINNCFVSYKVGLKIVSMEFDVLILVTISQRFPTQFSGMVDPFLKNLNCGVRVRHFLF